MNININKTEYITRETFWNLYNPGCSEHLLLHNFRQSDAYVEGLGSQLINYSIDKAKNMKFKGIILFGNPEYYKRFEFKNAKEYEITTEDGLNFDPFKVLELEANELSNVQVKFFIHKSVKFEDQQLTEFEKLFSEKEKSTPKVNIHK